MSESTQTMLQKRFVFQHKLHLLLWSCIQSDSNSMLCSKISNNTLTTQTSINNYTTNNTMTINRVLHGLLLCCFLPTMTAYANDETFLSTTTKESIIEQKSTSLYDQVESMENQEHTDLNGLKPTKNDETLDIKDSEINANALTEKNDELQSTHSVKQTESNPTLSATNTQSSPTETNIDNKQILKQQTDTINHKYKVLSRNISNEHGKKIHIKNPLIIIPPTSQMDRQKAILKGARQSSEIPSKTKATVNLGNNVPAFRKLMEKGIEQLKKDQLDQAEANFTHAQRMIPQSSAVYFYLGQVALKKQQPRKAQAFARRGLVVSDSDSRKRSLWKIILKAAEISGDNKATIEAKQALQ